jgi:hypothetical protein
LLNLLSTHTFRTPTCAGDRDARTFAVRKFHDNGTTWIETMPCDAEWVPAPGGWEEPVLYDNWYLPQDAPTHAERTHAEYMLAKQGWPPQMAAQMVAHAQQHAQHMQAMHGMPPQMAASLWRAPQAPLPVSPARQSLHMPSQAAARLVMSRPILGTQARHLSGRLPFLPSGVEALKRVNIVRVEEREKPYTHWVFYECTEDNAFMWAMPFKGTPPQAKYGCMVDTPYGGKQGEEEGRRLVYGQMAGREEECKRVEAYATAAVNAFKKVQEKDSMKARNAKRKEPSEEQKEAKRARDKAREETEEQREVRRARDKERVLTEEQREKKEAKRAAVRQERAKEANAKFVHEFGERMRDAKEAIRFRTAKQSERATNVGPIDTSQDETQQLLNAQYDADAALLLYNEMNGHHLSWAAEHPPPMEASEQELELWRREVIDEVIQSRDVTVTPQRAAELMEMVQPSVSSTAALCACAACGVRMASGYERIGVSDLPNYFRLDDELIERLEALREPLSLLEASGDEQPRVEDMPDNGPQLVRREVDLRKLFNYCVIDGVHYHLYERLVDQDVDGCPGPSCMFCSQCASHVREPRVAADKSPIKPACSLAAGVDYGNPEALGLPELSDVEKLLLSDVRLYAVVWKVAASSNKGHVDWQHVKLKGHTIFFVQKSTERLWSFLERSFRQRVEDLLHKVRANVLLHFFCGAPHVELNARTPLPPRLTLRLPLALSIRW